jgi:hypothetical protein
MKSNKGDIDLLPVKTETLKNHINVAVRLKPMVTNDQGLEASARSKGLGNSVEGRGNYNVPSAWTVLNDKTITDRAGRMPYHFDRVFSESHSTELIYN